MRKALLVVALLLVVQGLLWVVYLTVDRDRDDAPVAVERLASAAPDIVLSSPDGQTTRLSERRGSVVVLHFWATWCLPCREELPSLLAFASATEADVLAVSVDPGWPEVRAFVGEGSLDHVYRASADDALSEFGVETLPQTFVVDPAGTLRLRFSGPQAWDSPAIRAAVREVAE